MPSWPWTHAIWSIPAPAGSRPSIHAMVARADSFAASGVRIVPIPSEEDATVLVSIAEYRRRRRAVCLSIPPFYLAFSQRETDGIVRTRVGISDPTSFLSAAASSAMLVALVSAMTTIAALPFVVVIAWAFPAVRVLSPVVPWIALANVLCAFRLVLPMIVVQWSGEFARVVTEVWEDLHTNGVGPAGDLPAS